MGRFEKGSFLGVVVEEREPGESTVFCHDCFEKEEKKHKVVEVLLQEVLDDCEVLFVCDECGQQV